MVNVIVDNNKCPDPLECGKCMSICPQAVFYALPTKIHRFEITPGNEYTLIPRFKNLCTGCMECVKVCPYGAIEVKEIG